jgi:hypothetical protein
LAANPKIRSPHLAVLRIIGLQIASDNRLSSTHGATKSPENNQTAAPGSLCPNRPERPPTHRLSLRGQARKSNGCPENQSKEMPAYSRCAPCRAPAPALTVAFRDCRSNPTGRRAPCCGIPGWPLPRITAYRSRRLARANARHGQIKGHCAPVRLSGFGRSFQFGRTSTPIMPHVVHTARRSRSRSTVSSGQPSALMTAL